MRRILGLIVLATLSQYATAGQVYIGAYPNASTQLGSERIPESQSSAVVNVTPTQLGQYFAAQVTGDCSISPSFAIGCSSINGNAFPALVASQCLAANGTATALVFTGCGGGPGGGSPGGSANSIQYQLNGTTFGGVLPAGTGVWCIQYTSLASPPTLASCPSSSTTFDAIGSGTNTTMTGVVSTGASITFSGTGVVDSNQVNDATIPVNATILCTNASSQIQSCNGIQYAALTYAAINAIGCSGATDGAEYYIHDATTATFNATISGGGGSNRVKALCNGTNWTVH